MIRPGEGSVLEDGLWGVLGDCWGVSSVAEVGVGEGTADGAGTTIKTSIGTSIGTSAEVSRVGVVVLFTKIAVRPPASAVEVAIEAAIVSHRRRLAREPGRRGCIRGCRTECRMTPESPHEVRRGRMMLELPLQRGQGVVVGPVGEAAVVQLQQGGVGRHGPAGRRHRGHPPRGRERQRHQRVRHPVGVGANRADRADEAAAVAVAVQDNVVCVLHLVGGVLSGSAHHGGHHPVTGVAVVARRDDVGEPERPGDDFHPFQHAWSKEVIWHAASHEVATSFLGTVHFTCRVHGCKVGLDT